MVDCGWSGGSRGNDDVSTTLRFFTPITRALESMTACVLLSFSIAPIRV